MDKITASQWNKLNMIWVLFFVGVGILNIYVAYNFEEQTWAIFKVFGLMGLTFIFLLGQTLWIANIIGDDGFEQDQENK